MDDEERQFDPTKFSIAHNSRDFQKLVYVVFKNPNIRDSRSLRNFEETNEQGISLRPFGAWHLMPLGKALRKALTYVTPILDRVKDEKLNLNREIEIFWESKFGGAPGMFLERAPGAGDNAPAPAPTAMQTQMAAAAASAPNRVSLGATATSGSALGGSSLREGLRLIDPSKPYYFVDVVSDSKKDGTQYVAMIIPNMGGNNQKAVRIQVSDDGTTLTVIFVLGGDFNKPSKLQIDEEFAKYALKTIGPPYDHNAHRLLYGGLAHCGQKLLDGLEQFGIEYIYLLPCVCGKKVSTMWTSYKGTPTLKVTLEALEAKRTIARESKDENLALAESESEEENSPVAKRYRFD